MKVIFLDIDGVLINRRSCKIGLDVPDHECVERLNRIIAATSAVLVISSAWRIGRSVEELKDLMKLFGVKAKVIDRTICNWNWIRGQEIENWLSFHEDVTQFIILDDDSDIGELSSHLIQTKFEFGLTDENAMEAIERLNAKSFVQSA